MSYKIPNTSDVVMYHLYKAELLENAAIKGDYCLSKLDKSIYDSKGHRFDLDVEVLVEAIQANPDKVLTDAWQSKS